MIQTEPRIGVGVAIVENGKILLIKRAKSPEENHWALPGGKIDLFETCESAVIRETQEELGITIKDPFLLTIMDMWDDEKTYHWVAPIYLCTEYDGIPEIQEPNKHLGLDWFPINDLPFPSAQAAKDAARALLGSDI